jgi:archaellum biogenesis protein FlaJ (TadC family)
LFKGLERIDKTRISKMRKITTEILMIIVAIILLIGGLVLTLTYLDGRLLIGIALMAVGILLWSVVLRGVICQKQ